MANVSPAQFVRQVRQEASRITWASRRETGTATLTVFIMVAIAAVFFLLVDMVLSNVVQFVLWPNKTSVTAAAEPNPKH